MKITNNIKFILLLFYSAISFSQVSVTGSVYNEYLEPFSDAIIKTEEGNSFKTDKDGVSKFHVKNEFPQKIIIIGLGFEKEEITLTKEGENFNVVLKESLAINEIVISASRTPERILESPVDILNYSAKNIKKSIGGAYNGLSYLTGVQTLNNHTGFSTINTRGFGQFDNSRFVQLIDGIDMAIPASFLNQGDFGLPIDLDLESIEILPGSASALYGANAYNGLMLITTKSPFDHTGLDVIISSGGVNRRTDLSTYDVSLRAAYKFNEFFAAKASFGYKLGEQWAATDYRNIDGKTKEVNNLKIYDIHDFNGINTYGDESIRTYNFDQYSSNQGKENYKDIFLGVARTGFSEKQLLEDVFNAKTIRFNSSLNLKPFSNKNYEFIFANNISISDKIVQERSTRYALKDFYMLKSKLEFKSDNFFLRLTKSKNKTNEAYDFKSLGYSLNESLLTTEKFSDYGYANSLSKELLNKKIDQINFSRLRKLSDNYEGAIKREDYQRFLNKIKSTLNTENRGSKIFDESGYINIEGNYNFSKWINNFANFQIGGNYRKYETDSKGTIFNDIKNNIELEEFGLYTQVQKQIFDKRLKITLSGRYDKNQLFKGNVSPRIALNYIAGKNKNHVFRTSYQTGFRNPNMQELYSNKKIGAYRYVFGTAKNNNLDLVNKMRAGFKQQIIDYFEYYSDPGNDYKKFKGNDYKIANTNLDDILINSFTDHNSSYYSGKNKYVKSKYQRIKPEQVRTFELGYRSLLNLNTLNIDFKLSSYYSFHENFISLVNLTTPLIGKIFPKGEQYYTKQEIEKIKAELGDKAGYLSKVREDGKQQYLGSDVNWYSSLYQGMYRESSIYTNMKSEVKSYGFNVGAKTSLLNNHFDLAINYSYSDFEVKDLDYGAFKPSFNTPKHLAKFRTGYKKLIGNLGIQLGTKWSSKYNWQSEFASAQIPQRLVLDSELNYIIPSIHSVIKLGGMNLSNKKYAVAPGTGNTGSTYYLTWLISN